MLSRTAFSFIRRQSTAATTATATATATAARSFSCFVNTAAPSSLFSGDSISRHPKQKHHQHQHQHQHQHHQQLLSQQHQSRRSFSNHDDFAPVQKQKPPSEVDEAVEMIRQHVTENHIMLYMKGNPSTPMCGFSAKMVQTLQAEGIDFSSVNVLDYPSIREGIKKFASWPTIPQLYVNGEFIGGTDIVSEMHESGELKDLVAEVKANDESKE